MAPVLNAARIKLARLRDIGWRFWNPIGLLGRDRRRNETDVEPFEDEHDEYLIEAAELLQRGASDQEVVAFLVGIETGHMLLKKRPDTYARAKSTVAAIKADRDLWT